MNQQPSVTFGQILSTLATYPARWLVPALVVFFAAAGYALLRPDTWEASQALVVRNEAAPHQERVGKFKHTDEMKTVQETILELVGSRDVLAAVLKDVGPPANRSSENVWPSARDIAKLRKSVTLAPPKGAEFGTTEIFYLKVETGDRGRAVKLATAVVEALKSRFQQLLDDRAASMINEVQKTVALAETDLAESTRKLGELERSLGSDLAELRILHQSPSGSSDLRQQLVALESELRQVQTDRRGKAELLALLETGQDDPGQLLALPNRLLDSHAKLKRLIDGLSTARLNTCTLLGKMSETHPLVLAAREEEAAILEKVNREWLSAIQIAETELRLADDRVATLETQLDDLNDRFNRLAELRSTYANLVDQTQTRALLLDKARATLADARASQAAARAASLIDRIGVPETGIYPLEPSRSRIVLLGLVGGLLTGFGVLCLTAAPSHHGRARQVSRNGKPGTPPVPSVHTRLAPAQSHAPLSLKQALQKLFYGNTA